MSKLQKAIIEMVLGTIGFALFWYSTDFMTTFGLFIILFANNIKQIKTEE